MPIGVISVKMRGWKALHQKGAGLRFISSRKLLDIPQNYIMLPNDGARVLCPDRRWCTSERCAMLQEEHSYLLELTHRGAITFEISAKSFFLLRSILESRVFIKHKNCAALISGHHATSFHLKWPPAQRNPVISLATNKSYTNLLWCMNHVKSFCSIFKT